MKKILLLLFVLTVYLGYSQAPITNYDSANGSKFAIVNNTVDNSPTGEDVIWAFTGLTKDGEANDSYDAPTAQEEMDYPDTNDVFTATRNGIIAKVFSEDNAGVISITGIESEGFLLRYDNAAGGGKGLIGSFPLVFDNSTVIPDDIAGSFTYVPFNINGDFTGTITSDVDAHGSLTVSGTDIVAFNGEVTRLKVVQDLILSVANGVINQTSYNYYDDITGNLVFRTSTLTITSDIINDTTTITESFIEIVLGVSENTISNSNLDIFPNPVRNNLNFNLSEGAILKSISVYDITGRQVINKKVNTNSFDVSQLKTGVYIMTAITNKGSISSKFVKE